MKKEDIPQSVQIVYSPQTALVPSIYIHGINLVELSYTYHVKMMYWRRMNK